MSLEQANGLTDLLVRQPLAGFLALTLLAVVTLFFLLLREVRAHNTTLREVVALTAAISKQWDSQLEVMTKLSAVLDHLTREQRPRRRSTSSSELQAAPE